MRAEELIDNYLVEKVVKDKTLSGKEVAQLKAKKGIFVNGKHAVVVTVNRKGDDIELVYVKGRKAFGKEQYLDVKLSDSSTKVMSGKEVDEGMTPGLTKAYGKMEGRYKCEKCGVVVPKYEGRYPKKCASCDGEEFEDLQNSPRYSESYANKIITQSLRMTKDNSKSRDPRVRLQHKDLKAMDAKMRRVLKDRNPLGGPDYYEL